MKNIISMLHVFSLISIVCLIGLSDALHCSQCNMRQRGIDNTCKAPRNMSNCIGCMKTITKVKLRDSGYMTGWERMSIVTSRFCMRVGSRLVKPEGCYFQVNNGGYTERCFCYSDNCNSGAASSTFGFLSSIFSSPSSFTFLITAVALSLWLAAGCRVSALVI